MTLLRTVAYGLVFRNVARGVELGLDNMSADDCERVAAAISDRVAEGWSWAQWPEWTECELVDTSQPWDGWQWTILSVTDRDPREGRYVSLRWERTNKGIKFHPDRGAVWVTYRKPSPVFTGEVWRPDRNYAVGDLVWYRRTEAVSEGDDACYVCINATEGVADNKPGQDVCWALVPFPAVLQRWVESSARANLLRSKGNYNDAWKMEQNAYRLLSEAVDNEVPSAGRARR